MTAPDNTPTTSLEAILNKYASEYRAWMNLKSDEKPDLQKALAAIAAYYEGLLSEQSELRELLIIKFGQMMIQSEEYPNVGELVDAAIDTIRRHFKGERS